jgi:hypothetical protein
MLHSCIDILLKLPYRFVQKEEESMVKAYCVKCRATKEVKNPKAVVLKNKRPATQGVCPTCNTKVFRIGKA